MPCTIKFTAVVYLIDIRVLKNGRRSVKRAKDLDMNRHGSSHKDSRNSAFNLPNFISAAGPPACELMMDARDVSCTHVTQSIFYEARWRTKSKERGTSDDH